MRTEFGYIFEVVKRSLTNLCTDSAYHIVFVRLDLTQFGRKNQVVSVMKEIGFGNIEAEQQREIIYTNLVVFFRVICVICLKL